MFWQNNKISKKTKGAFSLTRTHDRLRYIQSLIGYKFESIWFMSSLIVTPKYVYDLNRHVHLGNLNHDFDHNISTLNRFSYCVARIWLAKYIDLSYEIEMVVGNGSGPLD